jgi:hypothetical protein
MAVRFDLRGKSPKMLRMMKNCYAGSHFMAKSLQIVRL